MNKSPKVCILGEVVLDVTLSSHGQNNKLRLGGILHAARALWALKIDYSLSYMAPEYLVEQVETYAKRHGAQDARLLATVSGSPNVVLITEPTEAGPQKYEFLLREEHRVNIHLDQVASLAQDNDFTDILIFSGAFDLREILQLISKSSAAVHIDIAYGFNEPATLSALGRHIETIITSTSSEFFLDSLQGSASKLAELTIPTLANSLLFKENRGGSRFFSKTQAPLKIQSQTRPILHSVGVGDCYNATFVALKHQYSVEEALTYSSYIAAEYASTTYPDDFARETQRVLSVEPKLLKNLGGVSLPWELRPLYPIYIAAPDFDYIDRRPIEELCEALLYHNFVARRPVNENGQAKETDDRSKKFEIYAADMKMLSECHLVIAILLHNDPGTLIEVGMAIERRMAVIVYDPFKQANNLILQTAPNCVTASLDEAIAETFKQISKIAANSHD